MAAGKLVSINTSQGGVPKTAIASDVAVVGELGLEGDVQANRKLHGGPERALCLWSADVIEALRAEGHPVDIGSAGENLTLVGFDWATLVPGTRLSVGEEVEIEISDYCTPCSKNAQWFSGGDFMRMSQTRHPGWSRLYARVVRGGEIRRGDAVSSGG